MTAIDVYTVVSSTTARINILNRNPQFLKIKRGRLIGDGQERAAATHT